MNPRCSIALLESALAGSLPADDEVSLHRHLEACEECSAALERMAGGTAWCQEAASLLISDELDVAVPTRDEWSEVDFTVEHLEPSDEPNVLGRLGGHDVLEIIGHGGMGVVLKAFDRELKRCVAIKVLAPHLAQSSLAKKRFAREAQAAAAVVHPHVLAIHQVQPNGRLPFLVMPLVAGESLAERLMAQGTLELKEILRIGLQAAAGLAAAHDQGLVHRDVKPANILLEKGVERAVLTDFGLAHAADDVALTRWGIIAGTPQYMSPEQARGEPLDGRSDLFSLGCVLYEMATGVSPFRTDSTFATLRRLVDDSPQPMGSLNPELPPWFIGIVDRLLDKDPSRRFGSAKEVSELLEACLAHVQQPASVPLPAGLPKPASGRAWRPSKKNIKGVIAMIGTLGIGLLGVFLLFAEPPDIAGEWSGEEWGHVVLKRTGDGEYTGAYGATLGAQPGEILLKWSRVERRFNGTWREGEHGFGELSVRLVGDEIRGAQTIDPKSKINPAAPRLADLTWTRTDRLAGKDDKSSGKTTDPAGLPVLSVPKRVHHFPTRGRVKTIAYSADGKLIAIANGNVTFPLADDWKRSVEIRDAESKIVVSLKFMTEKEDALLAATEGLPHFEVEALAFSPDGNLVAVATGMGQVKLLNPRTGELVRSLDDEQAKHAKTKTPEKLKSLTRAMGSVASLAFSPDGSLLAMCGSSFDDIARNWDGVDRLGRRATGPGRLKVWDVGTAALKHDLVGHSHADAVAFSPDGKLLASAGNWQGASDWGTGVVIWNPHIGKKIRTLETEANGGTHAVAFSPDSKLVAFGSWIFDKDNDTSTTNVSLAHAGTGIMEWRQTVSDWANPKAFSPDGKSVVVLCGGQSIRLIDTETGAVKHEIRPADSPEGGEWNDFAIAAQSHMLAISGIDAEKRGFVTVWSLAGASADAR